MPEFPFRPHPEIRRDGIYLDYNATTPVAPEVAEVVQPLLAGVYGNPSSTHRFGIEAATAVERARRRVAKGLGGVDPDTIVFTGGGSEAANLALKGASLRELIRRERPRRILTFATEHKCVLEPLGDLARRFRLLSTILPVDRHGRADPDDVRRELDRGDVFLVSLMLANNEVGTLQPVAEVGALCRERGVLLHCDAVQAFGKVPVDAMALGADLLTVSGHKLYALKGVGALYVRSGVELERQVSGGGQEHGLRAGTENVPGIVALGAAIDLALPHLDWQHVHEGGLRNRLWTGIQERIERVALNGHPEERLAGNLHFSIDGVNGQDLVVDLGGEGIACSAGSACTAEAGADLVASRVSHVLEAMGLDQVRARGSVRMSVGRYTTDEDIDRALEILPHVVARARERFRQAGG